MSLLFCLLLALFLFHFDGLAGTTGKIAGSVKDADNQEPLVGANIVIVGTTMGAATDAEGDYYIINVPPGTYSLKVTMMGYTTETKTEVRVNLDRTTKIDFTLDATTIEGAEVTVVAEREIVSMDISASQVVAQIDEIVQIPLVTDIEDFIGLQAGIEGEMIRGGAIDQTGFMMDGLMIVDNRSNRPMTSVNLSSIKEVTVIKGGFNAEYDNVRSGLINLITKEGSSDKYSGAIDFKISPPHLKHSGKSIFNPDNYYLRPYLDPAVCWEGTASGGWDEETQARYPSFLGWDRYAGDLAMDDDPNNDLTPEQARDLFMYQHRAIGSKKFGQKEGEYGHKPDYNIDAGFGGPVPFLNKFLGNLTFFASYRHNKDMFALPTNREYFSEDNALLKITSRITPSIKLTVEGTYGETHSVAAAVDNIQDLSGDSRTGSNYGRVNYVTGGSDILWTNLGLSSDSPYSHRGPGNLYWPSSLAPFDVYRTMQGVSLDHVLSPNTFYKLRVSNIHVKNICRGPDAWRDTSTVRYFGNVAVDEQPFGFWWVGGYKGMAGDGMLYSAIGAGVRDYSEVNTINIKFDLTSQFNKYNQIKTGFVFNYDDMNTHFEKVCQYCPGDSWVNEWRQFPFRVGAYVQDKLEFEGLIANLGLRLDYMQPNTNWYDVDRYSKYFGKQYKDDFAQLVPKEEAKSHLKISPRLGISHPISKDAKLYFNYGHFYSMAPAFDLYQIDYGLQAQGVTYLGNPSADLPRTTSYELGFEYDIADMYLVHISGYYKDVSDETGDVSYQNIDGSVSYTTTNNNHYADIRGFELRFEKRYGDWITGWINYNYMVETDGFIGRESYFQDPARQRLEGIYNPYMEVPLARPYARAYLTVHSPDDFGPLVLGNNVLGDIHISSLISWKAGYYETWDPLQTFQLQDNIQWKDEYMVDLRISKNISIGSYNATLYADIHNLFDFKYLSDNGFADGTDRRRYLESLHLPMYKGEEYQARGYTGGDDRPGDVKSSDKPYINMPNRAFLTYLDPRTVVFGLKFNF